MPNKTNTPAKANKAAHTAQTQAALVKAANAQAASLTAKAASAAQNVVIYVTPINPKKGALCTPRFATLTVGQTLATCRAMPHGYTAADVRYGQQRGYHLTVPANSPLHMLWQAASAKGASAQVVAAYGKAATAALAAQAATHAQKQVGKLPVISAAQKAGTQPAPSA